MVMLTGKNLGERQRDLNAKVTEAVAKKKILDEITNDAEALDTDIFYKIDVASEYRDINFIIEILKCGDGLYVSRALKCLWLYKDVNSHIINVENLHNNIFPYMSIKMKKKMLYTISTHLKNKDRAISFYLYCNKNNMSALGFKFLNITSEEFKLQILEKEGAKILCNYLKTEMLIKNFIKNSFKLATALVDIAGDKSQMLYNLRFLYSVSKEKYLDMLEKNKHLYHFSNQHYRLGLRNSKDIMVKHKSRVMKNLMLYISIIHRKVFIKYITIDDAKKYIAMLMPRCAEEFWTMNFCATFEYILEIIPENDRWNLIKQLFNEKYPDNILEMDSRFYYFGYYKMLSVEERELWALRHIEEQKDFFGFGKDYIWYKFVNLDKALPEVNKYIMKTPDADERLAMLKVLVESSRDHKDLIKLLNYYYDRHVNEMIQHKTDFINEVLIIHNIFQSDLECWEALNKLIYSIELYTERSFFCGGNLAAVLVCCHILYKQDMPLALKNFIEIDLNFCYFNSCCDNLSKEQSDIIVGYLLNLFVKRLQPFNQDLYNKELRDKLRPHVYKITNLLSNFRIDEKDQPEIVKRFLDIDNKCSNWYQTYNSNNKEQKIIITANHLYRFLKTDTKLAVDALTHFEHNIEDLPCRLNKVLRKLKIYFPNDVSQVFISFFNSWLPKIPGKQDKFKLIKTVIFGLFQLTDQVTKIKLMEKYCPSEPKINHKDADRQILFIQEAICRLVGYSRPPVTLENVLKYIKGDYTKYCLPLFNMYIVNLPLPQAIKFAEATLSAPLSVLKQGLRAAFKCFAISDLKNLVIKLWKNTKNISLQMIIYKLLFDKLVEIEDDAKSEIYETLKYFTSEIHQDNHHDVLNLILSGRMPHQFLGDYLQTAWDMVIKLPERPINVISQVNIASEIEQNILLVEKEFIRKRIIDEHVIDRFEKTELYPHETNEVNELYQVKWNITVQYISLYDTTEELEDRLALLTDIFNRCIAKWNERRKDKFVYREFYFAFIRNIQNQNVRHQNINFWSFNVPVLQHILDMLLKSLPLKEVYLTVWELQLTICTRKMRGNSFNCMSHHEISEAYANQVATLIQERLERGQLYSTFLYAMALSLNRQICHIQAILRGCDNFGMMFCASLAAHGIKEIQLLTLMILPEDIEHNQKENRDRILRNIQAFDDDEVQTFLSSKFVL